VSQSYESIRRRKYITVSLLVATTCLTIALSVFLIYHWEYVVKLEQHGYLGLFLISLLAGSPIPVPTPSMILTFTLGSLLNPLLIGLVAGLGNTIGNAFIYYTGRSGLKVISGFDKPDTKLSRFLGNKRISNIVNSRGWGEMAMVFLLFIYPNPVATPLILAMGATRFNLTRFLVICWSGKTVQGLIFAYLGHFGLRSLLRFLGVFNA
jgi:membrane protein YqaA with SNARE-associated domain